MPSLDTIIEHMPPLDTIVVDYVNHLDGVNNALASHEPGEPIIRLTDAPSWDELPRRIDSLNEFVDGDRSKTRVREINDDISDYAAFYIPASEFEGNSLLEAKRCERLSQRVGNVEWYVSLPLIFGGVVSAVIGLVMGDTSFDMYFPISLGFTTSAVVTIAGSMGMSKIYHEREMSARREHNVAKAKARKELNIPIPLDGLCAALLNNRDYIEEKLGKYRGAEFLLA